MHELFLSICPDQIIDAARSNNPSSIESQFIIESRPIVDIFNVMDRLRRLLHVLFALWFVFLVAEPIPAHDCPMHTPSGMSAHTVKGNDWGSHHHEHDEEGKEVTSATHFCLCLGCSSGSQSVAVGKVSSLGPIPHFVLAIRAPASVIENHADAPEFILPPSTAPPVLL